MAPKVKPGSKDTWDGYDGERQRIYQFIADQQIQGVIILSADRHRSDAYRVDTKIEGMYPLYEIQFVAAHEPACAPNHQVVAVRVQRETVVRGVLTSI